MGRAARDAGVGQVGRAGFEFDLLDVEAERVGGDLGERGPRALAHVVGADLHRAAAVAPQHRTRLGLKHQRREGRGAHAPADQHAGVVAHRPRLKRALRPAEALGAVRIAFAQRLGRERLAGDRFDLGIVREAEGERVHAAGEGCFIDRALQRQRAGGLAGRAHEQRRAGVDAHGLVRGRDRRAGVERVRGVGGRFVEVVEGAGGDLGVMIDRGEPARVVDAEAQFLARGGAMADRAVHVFTAQHQLDRPADQPRRQDAEHLRS